MSKIDTYLHDSEYKRSFENGSIIDKEVAIDRISTIMVTIEGGYKEIEESIIKTKTYYTDKEYVYIVNVLGK